MTIPRRARAGMRAYLLLCVALALLLPGAAATPVARAAPLTSVTVTTSLDTLDGDTSSLDALDADPGPDGQISLREAMMAAEATPPGPELTIRFGLAASPALDPGYDQTTQTWMITLAPDPDTDRSALLPPMLRGGVTIDGASQPGSETKPAIILNGFDVYEAEGFNNGLVIGSAGNTIRGLALINFFDTAIVIEGEAAVGNHVVGCALNTSPRGTPELPSTNGVVIRDGASANHIGGLSPEERNVIAGDQNIPSAGILISGVETHSNIVAGNWIGIDLDGGARGSFGGIVLEAGAHQNLIGGNVISGNFNGIYLSGAYENVIAGNIIGLDPAGDEPIGNDGAGITLMKGAHDNKIGGSTAAERNLIAASGAQGIYIYGAGSDNNSIQGNYIGAAASGIVPRGNLRQGVLVNAGATKNLVGGALPGEGNVIVYNGLGGVRIDAPGNHVTGNLIGVGADGLTPLGNQSNGIRIGGDDNIIGPNNTIAHNQVSGIIVSGAGTTIEGNRLEQNATSGICVTGEGTQILLNEIVENGRNGPTSDECEIQSGIFITGTNTLVYGNSIRGNWQTGISVYQGRGNSIRANSISENQLVGIELREGGNDALSPPVITRVTRESVSGLACAGCKVDVFADLSNQGADFIETVDADADGAFSLALAGESLANYNITATHTDLTGNTSPFAQPVSVPGDQQLVALPLVIAP